MYTKGDIEEIPTGWSIDILDPRGLIVATLDFIMVPGQRYTEYVEGSLNCRADALLAHLNR